MLKLGLLGAANIAGRSIVQPAKRSADATLVAVAARRAGAAAAYAAANGIERAFSDYEALLSEPDIDAVYVALPPAMHAEWSIRALEAGKHVLCEKPIAMSASEARRMFAVADRTSRVLMEAFHDRHHPVTEYLLTVVAEGRIGRIASAEATFLVDVPWDPKNIRFDPEQGGGAMMDLGCYPLHWLRSVFGTEPGIQSATAELTELGMDRRIEAELDFDGISARMTADLMAPPFRCHLRVEGTGGWMEIDNPCLPHKGHSIREQFADRPMREHTLAGGTTYDFQLAAFVRAVAAGKTGPESSSADSIGNMVALEAIYRAAGLR